MMRCGTLGTGRDDACGRDARVAEDAHARRESWTPRMIRGSRRSADGGVVREGGRVERCAMPPDEHRVSRVGCDDRRDGTGAEDRARTSPLVLRETDRAFTGRSYERCCPSRCLSSRGTLPPPAFGRMLARVTKPPSCTQCVVRRSYGQPPRNSRWSRRSAAPGPHTPTRCPMMPMRY